MSNTSVRQRFWLVVILTAVGIIISAPDHFPIRFNLGPAKIDLTISSPDIDLQVGSIRFKRDLAIKKGLDLQGGTQTILQAQMDNIPPGDREAALESAKAVITRRIDLYGVSETVIQTAKTSDSWRLIVELPGVTSTQEALDLIGDTAKLEFWEPDPQNVETADPAASPEAHPVPDDLGSLVPTQLTGQDLRRAQVQFDQNTGQPVIGLTFSDEGKRKFAEITRRNVGRRVGIFLDGSPLTIPLVESPITDGEAIISGGFTTDTAKQLVVKLNAGALPVDLAVVSQTQVGATLGEESISASVKAGLIGIGAVALFMLLVYRGLGLIATAALVIYGLLSLSVYKLIPVTLTLPGVAGFLLSIGMATDANILIFERIREERARGMKLRPAVELGFGRAWDSIKDANVATLLTAFILYNPLDWKFLNTSGIVRGFALTLTIGIAISLFTGIVVSRTLIRMFYTGDKR